TGTLFAYEQCGVTPDILTLAKALGNGLPIGAMLAKESVAKAFEPGSHASTFGGNPVVCAAAVATLRIMLGDGFLAEVRAKGEYLAERLTGLAEKYPAMATPARGLGLIQGLPLTEAWLDKGPAMVNQLFEKGVLLNFAGGKVLRCLPPLIISRAEIDRLTQALDEVFAELSR
ncbi:MAG: aminotransferase class III-fold pyridoxal phosphate-dependent enzyme, partial [Desulfurivibrionaceae bacterium]